MIIAVDFDGTICEHRFPEIGKEFIPVTTFLKEHLAQGDKLILWTCRSGEHLTKAVEWCEKRGIFFAAVNEDLAEIKKTEFGKTKSVKVFADIYVDDRNYII